MANLNQADLEMLIVNSNKIAKEHGGATNERSIHIAKVLLTKALEDFTPDNVREVLINYKGESS